MRPFVIPSLLLAVAACDEYDPTSPEYDYTIDVLGRFEPVNPGNPLSRWIGVETTRIESRQGEFVCEDTLDVNGAPADDDSELTLEMLRAEIRDLGESCEFVFDVQVSQIAGARFLSFDGHEGPVAQRGMVYTSSDSEAWTDYALGALFGDTLVYHRTWGFNDGERPDWEHRPLDELPID